MARTMGADDDAVFRAVITVTIPGDPAASEAESREGRAFTHYAGPYRTAAVARQAVSRERYEATSYPGRRLRGDQVTGHVERAALVWERID